ncbi:MAG: Radical superfamily enzyme YgiQ, family [Candidatus Eremiobacteraeota bacterium]|nr:Radical superfamily enzyme YgiQ, family [Candidatus Eremiobacteraeota bacterium]
MRVLLIWPTSSNQVLGWGDLGALAEPLALEYLGAGLRAQGHEPRILDLRLRPDELDQTIDEFAPDLVGITAFSLHVRGALAAAATIKRRRPEAAVIAGGHHATFLPEDFFTPDVDYVVCGNGVGAICDVANALEAGRPVPPVEGLWLRDGTEFRCPVPRIDFTAGLTELPNPDRTLTARDRHRYFIDWMKPVALMRTTIGCPYRCTFCSIWRAVDGRYIKRDIGAVVEELAGISEDDVFLVDDEAFIDGPRMAALAKAIRDAGIAKRYFTYCRIDTLLRNSEVIAAWRDIGLRRLFIGVDAVTPEALTAYNKRTTLDEIERGLTLARRLGIAVFAQFVVDPSYSARDFTRLSRFIEHHGVEYPSFTVLTPLPGTAMLSDFSQVVTLQPNGRPDWNLFDCQNAVTSTALPPHEFRLRYRGLYKHFKGAYTQYREHNELTTLDVASIS